MIKTTQRTFLVVLAVIVMIVIVLEYGDGLTQQQQTHVTYVSAESVTLEQGDKQYTPRIGPNGDPDFVQAPHWLEIHKQFFVRVNYADGVMARFAVGGVRSRDFIVELNTVDDKPVAVVDGMAAQRVVYQQEEER